MVHGSWTSWTWQDNARRYALWEVMPEVRWYPGEKKAWYVGAMFKAGQFNYKFSGTGRQGDLLGGGITGNTQTVTATLTYSDGNPADTSLESDLTASLADFNNDKAVPLTLGGTIAETPTEAGVEAGITGWETIDCGGVNAEL